MACKGNLLISKLVAQHFSIQPSTFRMSFVVYCIWYIFYYYLECCWEIHWIDGSIGHKSDHCPLFMVIIIDGDSLILCIINSLWLNRKNFKWMGKNAANSITFSIRNISVERYFSRKENAFWTHDEAGISLSLVSFLFRFLFFQLIAKSISILYFICSVSFDSNMHENNIKSITHRWFFLSFQCAVSHISYIFSLSPNHREKNIFRRFCFSLYIIRFLQN